MQKDEMEKYEKTAKGKCETVLIELSAAASWISLPVGDVG